MYAFITLPFLKTLIYRGEAKASVSAKGSITYTQKQKKKTGRKILPVFLLFH